MTKFQFGKRENLDGESLTDSATSNRADLVPSWALER